MAAGLAFPGVAMGRARRRHQAVYSHLRRSSYEPLVGQTFTLQGWPRYLRLVAVQDLDPAQAGSENAFALVFHSRPGAKSLAHLTPMFHHRQLGSFRMMVTPGLPSARGQTYTAIINRLHA